MKHRGLLCWSKRRNHHFGPPVTLLTASPGTQGDWIHKWVPLVPINRHFQTLLLPPPHNPNRASGGVACSSDTGPTSPVFALSVNAVGARIVETRECADGYPGRQPAGCSGGASFQLSGFFGEYTTGSSWPIVGHWSTLTTKR